MIAFIAGAVLAIAMHSSTAFGWSLVVLLWFFAVVAQIIHARLLNRLLGGADPVATYGARNLKQLRMHIRLPLPVLLFSFIARAFGWAGLVSALFAVGWLEIATVTPKKSQQPNQGATANRRGRSPFHRSGFTTPTLRSTVAVPAVVELGR